MSQHSPSEMMMLHTIIHFLIMRAEAAGYSHTEITDIFEGEAVENGKLTMPGATISELSEFTQMTSSAVSQTVKALEEKGYAVRTLSSTDRRLVLVNISEKGYQILREAEDSFKDYLNTITDTLGTEDTNRLIELLEKLADTLPPPAESPPPRARR